MLLKKNKELEGKMQEMSFEYKKQMTELNNSISGLASAVSSQSNQIGSLTTGLVSSRNNNYGTSVEYL